MTVARITHMKALPKNVSFWEYYILCRLQDRAAAVLQRFEFWDSTKSGGNIHAEQINEQLQAVGKAPTQDTSRWVYKSLDELAWEMMGSISERTLPRVLDILIDDLAYLKRRGNPISTFDHTKQYEFQDKLVGEHLRRLTAIVNHFFDLGRRSRPVLYAIEELVREGVYIAHLKKQDDGSWIEDTSLPTLSIQRVATKLRAMHTQRRTDEEMGRKQKKYNPVLPRFIRADLKKDEDNGFGPTSDTPSPDLPPRFRNSAETEDTETSTSNPQNGGNSDEDSRKHQGESSETIPVITPVITDNDYTHTGNSETTRSNQDTAPPVVRVSSSPTTDTISPNTDRTGSGILGQSPQTNGQPLPPSLLPIAKGTTIPPPPKETGSPPPISIRPAMPTGEDKQFTPEVILQVFEARRGRRYPNIGDRPEERMRDAELEWCRKLYELGADLWTENAVKNIKLLCIVCSQQENRREQWWLKRHGTMNPHQLVEKDRLHAMYDEIQRVKASSGTTGQRKDGEPSRRGVSGLLIPETSNELPLVVIPPKQRRRA